MKNKKLKSAAAFGAGFVTTFLLSVLTDLILENTGLMKQPFELNSTAFIVFVIFYRTLYTVAGCYIAAALAPEKPMRHALVLGSVGFVLTIAGAIAMWHIPPHWYPVSLIFVTLPAAWLGGTLKINYGKNKRHPRS